VKFPGLFYDKYMREKSTFLRRKNMSIARTAPIRFTSKQRVFFPKATGEILKGGNAVDVALREFEAHSIAFQNGILRPGKAEIPLSEHKPIRWLAGTVITAIALWYMKDTSSWGPNAGIEVSFGNDVKLGIATGTPLYLVSNWAAQYRRIEGMRMYADILIRDGKTAEAAAILKELNSPVQDFALHEIGTKNTAQQEALRKALEGGAEVDLVAFLKAENYIGIGALLTEGKITEADIEEALNQLSPLERKVVEPEILKLLRGATQAAQQPAPPPQAAPEKPLHEMVADHVESQGTQPAEGSEAPEGQEQTLAEKLAARQGQGSDDKK
jgi:hypothetical protein